MRPLGKLISMALAQRGKLGTSKHETVLSKLSLNGKTHIKKTFFFNILNLFDYNYSC